MVKVTPLLGIVEWEGSGLKELAVPEEAVDDVPVLEDAKVDAEDDVASDIEEDVFVERGAVSRAGDIPECMYWWRHPVASSDARDPTWQTEDVYDLISA